MRLLIINHEYPPVGGGGANASRFLATEMAQQGHQISVMTTAFEKQGVVEEEYGVRVHRIPALRRYIDRSNLPEMASFAAAGLALGSRIARSESTEGVIAFFTLPAGLIARWLARRRGLPYVISLRGADVPGLDPEVAAAHRRIRWLRQRVLRSAHAVVANSSSLAEISSKTDPFEMTVIPSGVDSNLFRPEGKLEPRGDRPLRILFAGRLRKQKNLSLLLEQLDQLARDQRMTFHLDVAGDGPLEPDLRRYARQLGIDGAISWHGWVNKAELIRLYQAADCFVNPSSYEGLPNTVLEAMACGLPVVASRVAGNDTLVANQQTGLLFGLDRPYELGDALTRIYRDPVASVRMGSRSRDLVVDRFSWRESAAAYLRLFEDSTVREQRE